MMYRMGVVGACLTLAGCGSLRPTDYAAGEDLKQAGVAIIGVHAKFEGVSIYDLLKSPKLQLARVKKNGERTELAAPLGSAEYGSVDGGYVYVKLPATKQNERYMIAGYQVNGGLGTGVSVLCRGKPAPAFAIQPGEIVYVGDISVSQDGVVPGFRLWWSFNFSRNTLAALDALTQKHPNLATYMTEAKLESADPDFGAECR
jgi:hypothetical protein